MNTTKYTRILIEGFQSAGKPLSFNLDNTGLNFIKGTNGVGKSTIFNSILWGEFNHNLKHSIATWEEYRPEGWRGTRVLIEREDLKYCYRIVRHLKFKGKTGGLIGGDKLMIFRRLLTEPKFTPEHLIGEGMHKSDMQSLINKQLGMDHKTLLKSIIFGQKLESLVTEDNTSKRDLFDTLFDASFVEGAKDKAKLKKEEFLVKEAKLVSIYNSKEAELDACKNSLSANQKVVDSFEKLKEERIKTAGEAENLAFKAHADAVSKLAKLKEDLIVATKNSDTSSLDKKLATSLKAKNRAEESLSSATLDISNTTKEIEKAKENKSKYTKDKSSVATSCTLCEQSLPAIDVKKVKDNLSYAIQKEDKVIDTMTAHLKSMPTIQNIAKNNLDKVTSTYNDIKAKVDNLSASKTLRIRIETQIESLESSVVEKKKELVSKNEAYKKEKNAELPKIDLDTDKKKIETIKKELPKIKTKTEGIASELERIKWWITKGFGSSGMKSFIFNSMLSKLNMYAHKYSSKLGFRVEFSIDMDKASKPFQTLVYKGNMVTNYKDLSGGQQQRVNICIAFAMHDLVTENSNINILVMDELFEGLDNEGVEVAFELIREKAKTKSVYIVTHNNLIDSLNSRSFSFSLDADNNTYLDA